MNNNKKSSSKIKTLDENMGDLEKMINEKNNLIKSGMYSDKDALIQKMDSQIRRMIDQN